jgi:hypothetical protein
MNNLFRDVIAIILGALRGLTLVFLFGTNLANASSVSVSPFYGAPYRIPDYYVGNPQGNTVDGVLNTWWDLYKRYWDVSPFGWRNCGLNLSYTSNGASAGIFVYFSTTGNCGGSNGVLGTLQCPANATLSGSTCNCNTGYAPNATATSCVLAACPAHASGTPPSCVCDAGYKFDAAGTSCIPEQYTIALSGLGGVVMPTKTRAAYAQVTTSTGAPKSGVNVDLLLTVEPENGGPVLASNVGWLTPNGGATDANGKLSFVFTAPVAGGTHTITADCPSCTNRYAQGTIRVPGCPIPPLSAPPFTDPVATGFENGNRWRPDLLTADYQTKLACVQNAITAAGGTSTPGSAYRPAQYQQHFYEIINTDLALIRPGYMTAHPECQALRSQVTGEMTGHGLQSGQDVALPGTSRHESGTAFDLTPHGLTNAQLTPIYTGCGVSHTAAPSEPWHVQ